MGELLKTLGQSLAGEAGVREGDPRRSPSAVVFTPGEKGSTEETRRLFRVPGVAPPFGIPMPGLVEAVLEQEDKRMWRTKGAVTAALGRGKGVVLTSSLDAEGMVGRVAAGLAAAMVLSERRSLVLLDLEYPQHSLQQLLGYRAELGLTEVLRGQYGLGDVTVSARDPRVGFLGSGGRRPGLWELGSLKAAETILELVQVFGLLIAALPAGDDGTTEVVTSAASGLGLSVLVIVTAAEDDVERVMNAATMVKLAGGRMLGWIAT
ncbi:MAG: hypothetical protein JW909_12875 [Planctomycetes bacterium]|nr:hypothetical protein [Planctomycetota bacterium]